MRQIEIRDGFYFWYHLGCVYCVYFGLTRLRITENNGYPFLCSTMSEFYDFCVAECLLCILKAYIYGLKIETSLILTLHMV